MRIKELSQATGVSDKTIRYYESIGVLPPPRRQENSYRVYAGSDVDRLQFVVGARALDFSLAEIRELLDLRDQGVAPCRVALDLIAQKAAEIQQRIADLQRLEQEMRQLHSLGLTFPLDDVEGKACVCHLISERA